MQNYLLKNKILDIINLLAILSIYLSIVIFREISSNLIFLNIQRNLNLGIYFLCLIKSYRKFNKNYSIFLFLISLFIFIYGRVNFIWLLPNRLEKLIYFLKISDLTIGMKYFIADLIFCNILGIYLALIFCKDIKYKHKNIIYKKNYLKIIKILVLFSLPFFIYTEYSFLKNLSKYSYLELFKIGAQNIKSNNILYIEIIRNLYIGLIYLGLLFVSKKKSEKIFFIGNFIFFNAVLTLRGQRGYLITAIFFVIYYICHMYEIELKIKKIFLLGIILILFSQFFSSYRIKNINGKKIAVIKKIEYFIYEQGVSGGFLVVPKVLKTLYEKNNLFILGPYLGGKLNGQSEKNIPIIKKEKVPLAPKISYLLDRELYLKGAGTGGNYILEMFDIGGKIGIIIFSYIFIFITIKISEYIKYGKMNIIRYLLILKFSNLFLSPRNNYLYFAIGKNALILSIGIYALIYFIVKTFEKKEQMKYE